jgi:hypothetical protein
MRRRPTTSASIRTWSRRLPKLAAAAALALCTSRASAQAYLGTPMPMQAPPPAIPGVPNQAPTPVPTVLPPTPYGGALQPSSLQSQQAFSKTPKVAEQTQILTQPIIPPEGAPQPTMAELRKSLRDDGLKNMGIPEFSRQIGAKPPTPPANMAPVTPESDGAWSRVWARMTFTYVPPPQETPPVSAAASPSASAAASTPPPDQGPWGRFFSRVSGTSTPPPASQQETPRQETPPIVQQTSATAPPDQPSLWYRLTHFRSGSQPDASSPQPMPQPTQQQNGPMVLRAADTYRAP